MQSVHKPAWGQVAATHIPLPGSSCYCCPLVLFLFNLSMTSSMERRAVMGGQGLQSRKPWSRRPYLGSTAQGLPDSNR